MAPATAAEALQKSSAVFSGRVVKIYRSFFDRVGITNTAGYRVQFEITKQWKGIPSKSTVVITRLSGEACGFPFEENKEYLVYVVSRKIFKPAFAPGQRTSLKQNRKWNNWINCSSGDEGGLRGALIKSLVMI